MSEGSGAPRRIEGDYDLSAGQVLDSSGLEGIEVTGTLRCRGPGRVEGSLRCAELRVDGGDLEVRGTLTVAGEVNLHRARLEVANDLNAGEIRGDKALTVRGSLHTDEVELSGNLDVVGRTTARRVEVGGTAELRGPVELSELEVGGRVVVGGGAISERVEVGGRIDTTASLRFRALEVGGWAQLGASAEGETLEVGGTVDCTGDLTLTKSIEVGGRIRVEGTLRCPRIEVGGLLHATAIDGEEIEVGGAAEVVGALSGRRLEVGGRLVAERVTVRERVEVGEEILTRTGLKSRLIRIEERSVVRGPLVGTDVTVGRKSVIEDVWATRVLLEERVVARNVYADRIELEEGVTISGATLYTQGLEPGSRERIRFGEPPRQVSDLPPPPL